MGFILKLLGGALGPWISGGVLIALALGLATSCTQGRRVEHLKGERDKAVATSNLNYTRALEWRDLVIGPRGWKAAYEKLNLRRLQDNADTARIIERGAASQSRASSSAFNQGYAAGRAVRLRTQGATNETPSTSGPAAVGGVRNEDPGDDLAAVFRERAYRYAARLSANP